MTRRCRGGCGSSGSEEFTTRFGIHDSRRLASRRNRDDAAPSPETALLGAPRGRIVNREFRIVNGGFGGDEGTRTPYLSDANAALSRMSYVPTEHCGPLSIVGSGPILSQPNAFREPSEAFRGRRLASVGGTAADAVARLARKLSLFAALLTSSWRQLASWWFKNPVMHAFAHHLQRFSLGHSESFPSTSYKPGRSLATKRPRPCGSVVVGIGAFNGSFRIGAGRVRHVSFTRTIYARRDQVELTGDEPGCESEGCWLVRAVATPDRA